MFFFVKKNIRALKNTVIVKNNKLNMGQELKENEKT